MQEQITYYNPQDELDEELNIDFKKIIYALLNRKKLIVVVFCSVLLFFILLTFVLPKKWKVEADLYVNKTNNSNFSEINPFVLDETGGSMLSMGSDKSMNNELELIQSSLVIDNVVRENDLRFGKIFNIIPTKKTDEYLTKKAFLKKNIKFENKKNTNVISIEYKSKKQDKAYSVVESIIRNYIKLHQELNSEKIKLDKKIIESEYIKAKEELDRDIAKAKGLPANAISGASGLVAMSQYSKSAQNIMGNIQGQYIANEKSRIDLKEKAEKVSKLAAKLEWVKMVEGMSDSSKVIVINEPKPLKDYEYASPKLLKNIIFGIILGVIAAITAAVFAEITDKKLCYLKLGSNIIYDLKNEFLDLKLLLLSNKDKKISVVMFENIEQGLYDWFREFQNLNIIKADINDECLNSILQADEVIMIAKIGVTESKIYKQIKNIIEKSNKEVIKEILI